MKENEVKIHLIWACVISIAIIAIGSYFIWGWVEISRMNLQAPKIEPATNQGE